MIKMKRIINISNNKTLKLTNVVSLEIDISDNQGFNNTVIQLENYIKSKGAISIGPLIQKTFFSLNQSGEITAHALILRQTNKFINKIEKPYNIDSIIRVQNCIYVHYIGPEEKLKLVYDKINVTAFEEDIELKNENYTIFVDQQDDDIIADIFVERKPNE